MDLNRLKSLGVEHVEPELKIHANEVSGCLLLDARSESEFDDHHILGAYNIPLLQDDARAIVGRVYHEVDQSAAVETGWRLVEDKIDSLIGSAESLLDGRKIVVYCARGGMRSRILANLLTIRGHKVYQLVGGIKAYRNWLYKELDSLCDTYKGKFIVLEGQTGTQKTKLLKLTKLPVIDLEGLAQHRSSVYGNVHLNPRNQKMFLFNLYKVFKELHDEPFIVLEGESRRIGFNIIPDKFFKLMNNGIFVNITALIQTRIDNIKEEYFHDGGKAIIEATPRLRNYIGKRVDWLIDLFQKGEYDEGIQYLLEEYYDKKYKMHGDYSFSIRTDDLDNAVKELESFVKNL